MGARLRFSEVTATALTIRRLGNMFGKKVHPCLLHFPILNICTDVIIFAKSASVL